MHRLAEIGPSSPRRLLAAAFEMEVNQKRVLPYLWRLIARGRITADLGRGPPTMVTTIWVDRNSNWRQWDPYSRARAVVQPGRCR